MPAPVAPPTNTLLDREVTWLNGSSSLVALVKPTAYSRKRQDGAKSLDLRITNTVERRIAIGKRERIHTIEALITWPVVSGASSMTDDQRYLGAAVEQLLTRIEGALGDHSHGGLFLSVGEDEDGNQADTEVEYSDPIAALELDPPVITATVTYRATELLITN